MWKWQLVIAFYQEPSPWLQNLKLPEGSFPALAENILLPSFVTSCRCSLHFDHYSSYYWRASTEHNSKELCFGFKSHSFVIWWRTLVVSGWIKNLLCLIKRSKDCLPPLWAKYLISGHWFKIWALLISDLPRIQNANATYNPACHMLTKYNL